MKNVEVLKRTGMPEMRLIETIRNIKKNHIESKMEKGRLLMVGRIGKILGKSSSIFST